MFEKRGVRKLKKGLGSIVRRVGEWRRVKRVIRNELELLLFLLGEPVYVIGLTQKCPQLFHVSHV